MKEDWDILPNEVGSKDLTPLLHKLHFLINSQSESFSRKSRLKRMLSWYTRVAAVLLLPLFTISAILFFFSHEPSVQTAKVEVVAPMGARVKTELPDGTIVWLNGGSVLSYSASFEQRNVNVCGKAFFDVKSDSLNPFTVKGNKAAVKVFGTRFNVEMWPDEETVEVVLEEGKVELIPDSCEQSFKMVPGELLVFNFNERKLIRQRVNPKRYSAWIDGKLMLRGEDMRELARELSHWFNADVVVKDSTLSEYTFRATFEDERLEDVLRLLKMTSPIDYEILDNMQDSSGNFSKKKVIIRHQ
ncbi:FecR domain-containing protein [Marinilabilia sp.]|uniref:FecR family protein n=1 Tax=Marinilabilia sp. TaxID=2021252 RepID=UPI0025BCE7BF|nr:FecR domain-containing protein [Marinilabilia sp.]